MSEEIEINALRCVSRGFYEQECWKYKQNFFSWLLKVLSHLFFHSFFSLSKNQLYLDFYLSSSTVNFSIFILDPPFLTLKLTLLWQSSFLVLDRKAIPSLNTNLWAYPLYSVSVSSKLWRQKVVHRGLVHHSAQSDSIQIMHPLYL